MQPFKLIIFDVDGTLLDTTEGVLSAVKYTIKKFSLPEISENVLKTFIGPPIQNSFSKTYNLEGDILQDLATVFRNQYKDKDLLKAVVYDGIYEVCEQILKADKKIAVATYKRHDYATDILKHFHFNNYTDNFFGADHENKLTKSDIILKCMKTANVDNPDEVVMIGDSDNDAIGAEKLGINFIAVTYGFGFHTKEEANKYQNIGIAETPLDILKFIL